MTKFGRQLPTTGWASSSLLVGGPSARAVPPTQQADCPGWLGLRRVMPSKKFKGPLPRIVGILLSVDQRSRRSFEVERVASLRVHHELERHRLWRSVKCLHGVN